MKKILLFLLASLPACFLQAQHKDFKPGNIYPRAKPITVPGDFTTSDAAIWAFFNTGLTCAAGNCTGGEGTCFYIKDAKYDHDEGTFAIPVFVWKGNFSNDGKDFHGKKYHVIIQYRWVKGYQYKKIEPVASPDLTDETLLQQNYESAGFFSRSALAFSLDFDRNFIYMPQMLEDDPAATRSLPHAVSTRVWYQNNFPVRIIASYEPSWPLRYFAGFCNPDYSPALGSAMYKADTAYTGFFLQGNPFGAGILTPKNGKPIAGFFNDGALVQPAPVSFPGFVGKPQMPVTGGHPFTALMDGQQEGTLWGEGEGLFKTGADWYYFSSVASGVPVKGNGSYLSFEGPNDSLANKGQGTDIKCFQFSGQYNNGKMGQGTQARQIFKLAPGGFAEGDIRRYKSLMAITYTGNRDAEGKKTGCILVKQLVQDGHGSFTLQVPYAANVAINPCWGRVLYSDNIHLPMGLVFLDDENNFNEVMHSDRDPLPADYSLAFATRFVCNAGTEKEKQDYLALLLQKIEETKTSREAYAKQQADAKAKEEAGRRRAAEAYIAAHPEIAIQKQALETSRAVWASLGLSSGAGLGHSSGGNCVFDERFVESYNDETGMVTINYGKTTTISDYFGTQTNLIRQTVPASTLAGSCFTGSYYVLCPRCHGNPVGTRVTLVNAYKGSDGLMHGDRVSGLDKCERCRLHGYVPVRQHGEPGFW